MSVGTIGTHDAANAVEAWNPRVEQELDQARGAIDEARRLVEKSGTRNHSWAATSPEVVANGRRAVENLQTILVEWEDIPEPALDALRGAVHEMTQMLTAVEQAEKMRSITPPVIRIAEHLDSAIHQLGRIAPGA